MYQLKYYTELESQGNLWRLEIHQDTEEAISSLEIGPVLQGLRLILQGDQADVDTPIVKTSLEIVLVDAPDLDDTKKCGDWEEFYTSSSTEYKVNLYKNNEMEWSGYLTPDSYSESLQYRGSVKLIARDNLGALQDYEYDYAPDSTGMISLINLVHEALDVVAFPMGIYFDGGGARHFARNIDSDVTSVLHEVLFNNESFIEGTWLDALESVLKSTGLVLRYVGSNQFVLAPIRDIPLYDHLYWWDVPVLDTIFCAYGTRELSPAVKTVIDEVRFDIEENIASINMPAKAYGEAGEYEILTNSENLTEYPLIYPMPIHAVVNGSWNKRDVYHSLFFNAFAYPLKEGYASKKIGDLRDTSVVYLAANQNEGTSTSRSAEWTTQIGPGKYKFSFKVGTPIALYDDASKVGFIDLNMNFSRFKYNLRFASLDGSEKFEYRISSGKWDKGSSVEPNSLYPNVAFPVIYEFPTLEVTSVGELQLVISYVGVIKRLDSPDGISKGAYVPIQELSLTDASLESSPIPNSMKTTTLYNNKNNILLQRSIDYGFNIGDVASPHIIKNGMFIIKDSWYDGTDQWKFNNSDIPNPLPVLMHQQLLAFYSKPNNILSGELATPNPLFNALYQWNGKEHLLMSGALNLISGRLENVILREFKRYSHMWETWTEEDDIIRDYNSSLFSIKVYSKEALTVDAISNLPAWLTCEKIEPHKEGWQLIIFRIKLNDSGVERQTIFRIDAANVRLTQKEAGDYGIDYGEDYS